VTQLQFATDHGVGYIDIDKILIRNSKVISENAATRAAISRIGQAGIVLTSTPTGTSGFCAY
jgi:hypothetical protein